MRLRFWRKGELAVFDPAAGEMPEHLEVYPPAKPFSWRAFGVSTFWAICRGGPGVLLVSVMLRACDDPVSHEQKPQPLVVFEAATVDAVCAEGSHFLTLRSVAPCDPESREALKVATDRSYYVAFASRGGGSFSVTTPAYLLEGNCYDAIHGQDQSVEHCVVAGLRP